MVFYGSSGEGSRLRCHQYSYETGLHETLWGHKSHQYSGDPRIGLGFGRSASGDFRYRRTVFRETSNSRAISRILRPAPFNSYIFFTSPTFNNLSRHLLAVCPDNAIYFRWVNSDLLLSPILKLLLPIVKPMRL